MSKIISKARMVAELYPAKYSQPAASTTLTASYDGGSYIHLFFEDERTPFDAINVWDYETNVSTIENTMSAVWTQLKEWVDRLDKGDLMKHRAEKRRG
jgi:hypothetical protein